MGTHFTSTHFTSTHYVSSHFGGDGGPIQSYLIATINLYVRLRARVSVWV